MSKSISDELEHTLIKMATDVLDLPKTNHPIGKPIDETKQAILNLIEQREAKTMQRFGLKKGVKYDVKASDKVIVITPSELKKGKE